MAKKSKNFTVEQTGKFLTREKKEPRYTFTLTPEKGKTDWWIDQEKGKLFLLSVDEGLLEVGKTYSITIEEVK